MRLSLFIITSIFFVSSSLASLLVEPEVFPSAPTGVYAPQGFDTNDNVEIFFEGEFSNACYKVGLTFHTVDEENKKIYITDTSHYFGDAFCAAVMVPYQKGINTGLLSSGEYRVFFKHSRGNFVEQAYFPVRKATNTQPDDYLYAPVKSAQYYPGKQNQAGLLKLRGTFNNSCMKIDQVKVVQHPDSNVVDILPIAIMDRGDCQTDYDGKAFEHDVDLSTLDRGRFLLHIRSLNGQSVNEIVSVH